MVKPTHRILVFTFFFSFFLINFLITLNEFTEYSNQILKILFSVIFFFLIITFLLDRIIIFLSKTFLMGNHGGLFQGEMVKVYH